MKKYCRVLIQVQVQQQQQQLQHLQVLARQQVIAEK
jgi:hypothetical protein